VSATEKIDSMVLYRATSSRQGVGTGKGLHGTKNQGASVNAAVGVARGAAQRAALARVRTKCQSKKKRCRNVGQGDSLSSVPR
jgi:hypothetical protein